MDVASFGIRLAPAEAEAQAVRLMPTVQSDATVASFLCIVEVTMKPLGGEHARGQLRHLGTQFLHAHNVRPLPVQPLKEPLPSGSTDAIHVDGDDAHD